MGKDSNDKIEIICKKMNLFFKLWIDLFKELANRLIDPVQSPNFILYFIVIVIGVGGIGPWINLAKKNNLPEFYYSVATFALTLASASFADVVLYRNRNNSIDENKNYDMLTFPYTCIFFITAASAVFSLIICGFFPENLATGANFSLVSLFFGIFLWWQVNSRNPQLYKAPLEAENALGDDTQIHRGDTAGYKIN